MNKNIFLAVGITILFLGVSICPTHVSSTTTITNNKQAGEIFFGLKSHVGITWDENESLKPIMPLGGVRELSFNISYWVTWGIFGRITNRFLSERGVKIDIDIIDKPEYCEASFRINEIYISFPKKQNIKESYNNFIYIVLDENAPAYEEFNITIQVTMDWEIKGPLGFITFLSPANKTVNITLIPDYWGVISYWFPEGYEIETPPLIEKQLPIMIGNIANGKTLLECEVNESPPGFLVYFDPKNLILEVGGENMTNLKITAPSNFSGEETIEIHFTPHYYYNYSIVGYTFNETINVFYYPP